MGARRMTVQARIRLVLLGFFLATVAACGGSEGGSGGAASASTVYVIKFPARRRAGHAERPDGAAFQGACRATIPRPRPRRSLSVGPAHGGHGIDRGARVRRGADDRGFAVAVRPPHAEVPSLRPAVLVSRPHCRRALSVERHRARVADDVDRAWDLGLAVLAQRHETVLGPAAVHRRPTTRAGSSSA